MNYTVLAASKATGINSSRLRTWERRYGIPRPNRSNTGRRLYNDDDLILIRRMMGLVNAGLPASEAAKAALSSIEIAIDEISEQKKDDPYAKIIATAAINYDETTVVNKIRAYRQKFGWARTFDEFLMPGLRMVGSRWSSGALKLGSEPFISAIIRREILLGVAEVHNPNPKANSVIIACPQEEQHDLGSTALWLLLKEAGLRVIYLGADVPTTDLIESTKQLMPSAVVLIATAPNSLPTLGLATRGLLAEKIKAKIFVGGSALAYENEDESFPGVRLPSSIESAADVLIKNLG